MITNKDRRYMLFLIALIMTLVLALSLIGCVGFQGQIEEAVNKAVTASTAARVAQVGQAAQIAGALVPGPGGNIMSYAGYGLGGIATLMGMYAAGKAREKKREAAEKANALDK